MRTIDPDDFGPWCFGYEPEPGDVIERGHPFTRMVQRFEELFGTPAHEEHRWRPGAWLFEPYGHCAAAHAMGSVRLHVIDVATPPGYPRRIFYTRRFTDPDGKAMKKSGLIVHAIGTFRQIVSGQRLGTYEIMADAAPLERRDGA